MPSGPCLFRSLIAAAEEKTGKNLSIGQIAAIGKELHASGDIGTNDEYYEVQKPEVVLKAAPKELGYPDAQVKVGNTGESTGKADFTIRFIKSNHHYQLGDASGKIKYEPYKYNNSAHSVTGDATSLRDVTIILTPEE